MELTAIISPANEGGFTSWNPETGSASQGETQDEALTNLIDATTLYLEEFPLSDMPRTAVTTFRIN
ncbi:MAG: type II toxin-antitoxin system HicB family antitoxin [Actinomycetota bacterium]